MSQQSIKYIGIEVVIIMNVYDDIKFKNLFERVTESSTIRRLKSNLIFKYL